MNVELRSTALEEPQGTHAFATHLLPVLADPRVRALGPEAGPRLRRRALARHLHATVHLETRVVDPVLLAIACGDTPWIFREEVRESASKLHVEEQDHAREATALAAGLGLDPVPHAPAFARGLIVEAARWGEDASGLRLCFTIVSETLVSRTLSTAASAPELDPRVRDFLRYHAEEEVRHAAWFSARCAELWPQLGREDRSRWTDAVPRLIALFLAPDREAERADLVDLGLPPETAADVVDAAYSPIWQAETAREAGRTTRQCFARAAQGVTHQRSGA